MEIQADAPSSFELMERDPCGEWPWGPAGAGGSILVLSEAGSSQHLHPLRSDNSFTEHHLELFGQSQAVTGAQHGKCPHSHVSQ